MGLLKKFSKQLEYIKYPKQKISWNIAGVIKGKNGFGYDPIFIPSGYEKTYGEMEPAHKMSIDHRYKAYLQIKKFFKKQEKYLKFKTIEGDIVEIRGSEGLNYRIEEV